MSAINTYQPLVEQEINLLPWKQNVQAATTTELSLDDATAQVLTGDDGLPAQDGVTMVAGDRLLVKDQDDEEFNGIYDVTTPGVIGVAQVETATIVSAGGITGNGNATITVTSALVTGSPLAVPVAVLNGDSASVVGGKVRTVLGATAAITDHYTVGGSGANYTLTALVKDDNDATLNMASANGTCTGLTAAPTSTNTTAGVAIVPFELTRSSDSNDWNEQRGALVLVETGAVNGGQTFQNWSAATGVIGTDPILFAHYSGSTVTPGDTLVTAGDSNTSDNIQIDEAERWPNVLLTLNQFAGKGITLENEAHSNETTGLLAGRYDTDIKPHRPQNGSRSHLMIWVGAKDIVDGSSAATIFSNLESIVTTAQADGFIVWLFTIAPQTTSQFNDAKNRIRQVLNGKIRTRSSADRIVEVDRIIPDYTDTDLYNADGIHINEAGNVAVARLVNGLATVNAAPGRNGDQCLNAGKALIYDTMYLGGTFTQTDATDASSSVTGALKTAGGLAVAKSVYVGVNLNINNSLRCYVIGPPDGGILYLQGSSAGAAITGIEDALTQASPGTTWGIRFNGTEIKACLNGGGDGGTFTSTGAFRSVGETTVRHTTATPANGSTSARLLFGTTAAFGVYYGSGAPTVVAAKGSLYLRSDGSGVADRMYVATDSAGAWTAIATAG